MTWLRLLVACAGCYALKAGGALVPRRWVDAPEVQRITALLPVALMTGLVVVGTFGDGRALTLDARAVGVGIGVVATLLRAPFAVVLVLAAAAAALVRLA